MTYFRTGCLHFSKMLARMSHALAFCSLLLWGASAAGVLTETSPAPGGELAKALSELEPLFVQLRKDAVGDPKFERLFNAVDRMQGILKRDVAAAVTRALEHKCTGSLLPPPGIDTWKNGKNCLLDTCSCTCPHVRGCTKKARFVVDIPPPADGAKDGRKVKDDIAELAEKHPHLSNVTIGIAEKIQARKIRQLVCQLEVPEWVAVETLKIEKNPFDECNDEWGLALALDKAKAVIGGPATNATYGKALEIQQELLDKSKVEWAAEQARIMAEEKKAAGGR